MWGDSWVDAVRFWELTTVSNFCEQTVEEALEGVSGVRDAEADRDAERATVDGDADTEAFVAAVEDAGFDATA